VHFFYEEIVSFKTSLPVQEFVFCSVTLGSRLPFSQAHSIHRFFVIDVQQLIGKRTQDLEEIPFGFGITPNDFNGFA
jgi:hypothetical protein